MASKTKVCPKCGIEKDRATGFTNYVCKKRNRTITKSWCKVCTKERQRKRYHEVKEVRDQAKKRSKAYREAPEYRSKFNKWRNKWRRKNIKNLGDSYIKERLRKAGKEITEDSKDLARTNLLLLRIKRKIDNGEN